MTLKTRIIIGTLVALTLAGAVFAFWWQGRPTPGIDIPKEVSESAKNNDTDSNESSNQAPQEPLPQLAQPTLRKSSGNNAPVPKGALMEFVCADVINTSCVLTLTSQQTGEILKFDPKDITDNGRGQAFVSWVWDSRPGTWTAVVTVSAEGYSPTSSEAQTFGVES